MSFSPDGKTFISISHNTIKLWDIATGKEIKTFKNDINSLSFSSDGKTVISCIHGNIIKLWDRATGKEIKTFVGHTNSVNSVSFSPNGKTFISTSFDNTIKLWDVATGKELATLIPIDSTDWIVTTPSGLFDASEGAMQQMHFVQGMEVIELTQLKARYYEPGLLQKIMNNENIREVPEMGYLDLYPEIELSEIHYGEFGVFLTNQGGGIGRVQIFINGKEITADARPADADPNAEKLTIIYTIANHPYLSPNVENRITVKVYNAEGWLVSRPVHGYYIPERGKAAEPHLYILSIGVSDYANDDLDLRFANNDAIDMATALQLGGNGLFGEENTHT